MIEILRVSCYKISDASFHEPTTGSKCSFLMLFFNALQFWKNISDNDFAVDLKKFRSNYFDCIIGKFTPASLKQTEYSRCYSCDFKSYVILSFIKFLVSCYFSI